MGGPLRSMQRCNDLSEAVSESHCHATYRLWPVFGADVETETYRDGHKPTPRGHLERVNDSDFVSQFDSEITGAGFRSALREGVMVAKCEGVVKKCSAGCVAGVRRASPARGLPRVQLPVSLLSVPVRAARSGHRYRPYVPGRAPGRDGSAVMDRHLRRQGRPFPAGSRTLFPRFRRAVGSRPHSRHESLGARLLGRSFQLVCTDGPAEGGCPQPAGCRAAESACSVAAREASSRSPSSLGEPGSAV